MSTRDKYGLPAKILVELDVDRLGSIILKPVNPRIRRLLGVDDDCEVFAQEATMETWANTLPRSAFIFVRGQRAYWNDGARFYMDSWTYRHLMPQVSWSD